MFYASSHRMGDGGHYVFDLYVLSERACVLSEAFSNQLAVELSGILERKKTRDFDVLQLSKQRFNVFSIFIC